MSEPFESSIRTADQRSALGEQQDNRATEDGKGEASFRIDAADQVRDCFEHCPSFLLDIKQPPDPDSQIPQVPPSPRLATSPTSAPPQNAR